MAYLPIKTALIEGVKQFAFEMADAGGCAVCVSPGHTFTREHAKRVKKTGQTKKEYEMTAGNIQNTLLKRFLEPEEIAVWVAIAASHYGRLITGTEILVDAGIAAGGFNGGYVIPDSE
jgi:NAD(P)-dependent dehydrogenase (short-subunit alcohol dehydrogenase family)